MALRDVRSLAISDEDMRQTPKPTIENVVVTYSIGNSSIAMERLATRLPGVAYNPAVLAAAVMRLPRPMTLAFSGGHPVCLAARSINEARLAALRFTELHARAGECVTYNNFRVHNIVMSVWLPFEVNLPSLVEEWSAYAEWTPSKFPGVSFSLGADNAIIKLNVFVTGRVVITKSKDERDSYKAWYWFYTNVLVRHQRGTAAGTTSSSAYRLAVQRQQDTFADDCRHLASVHTRRPDGPMARTPAYSNFITQTPRTASRHAPSTMRTVRDETTPMPSSARPTTARLQGHTSTCAYMRTPATNESAWFVEYVRLGTLSDAAVGLEHPSCSNFTRVELMAQVLAVLGEHRVARIVGEAAPLRGHTLACPLVCVARADERRVWTEARETLELALAGGVLSLEQALEEHRRAGCCTGDEYTTQSAREVLARTFVIQLHAACGDFDSTSLPATPSLTIDDVVDYEVRFRIDTLRAVDDPCDVSFEL